MGRPAAQPLQSSFTLTAIGLAIDANCQRIGVSHKVLASRVGITASMMSRIITGGSVRLNVFLADDMARAFGLNINELINQAADVQKSGIVEQITQARTALAEAQAGVKATLKAAISPT